MITKPTLLLDSEKCKKNMGRMAAKAAAKGLSFRPHFKTHQSLEIGRWYREFGVTKITVSSLSMAGYFSGEWNDITIAFPVNILELDTINELASKITLNIQLENFESAAFLSENLRAGVGCFIKIDVGTHRTGADPKDTKKIEDVMDIIDSSDHMSFRGFLAHSGHTYRCTSKKEVIDIHEKTRGIMLELKQKYKSRYPYLILSVGDTPSCSLAENFEGLDEIRPGNFAFYDLTQENIGSNQIEDIAVAMACPLVAKHPERLELVIYGGGVHFSKDGLKTDSEGLIYGKVVEQHGLKWGSPVPGMVLKSVSQEHGIVKVPGHLFDKYKLGDLLYILPVHSCLTADLMKSFFTTNGELITIPRLV